MKAAIRIPDELLALADEVVDLEPTPPTWSLKSFCGGHQEQYAIANDNAQWLHLLCARQSGKTQIDCGIMIDRWRRYPNSLHIFLGLNGVAVRENAWTPAWLRTLDRYGIRRRDNGTIMKSVHANGARAIFSGTDDLKHVRNVLGNRLENGTFIIDESQDQPPAIIDYLLDVVLPPMMTPTTKIIMSGVRPDLPGGRFYAERLHGVGPWAHHSFARWSNVHTPEAREQLNKYLHDVKIDWADIHRCDPTHETFDVTAINTMSPGKVAIILRVLRDWLNRDVYDPNAREYMYREEVNGYTPTLPEWARDFKVPEGFGRVMFAEPWPGIDQFSVGIDPGGGDPFGLQVIGWGKRHRRIQHLVDWTSPRNARLTWGDVMRVLGKVVALRYPTRHWRYDTNSDTELDTFGHEYGVPVIRAAKKADMKGQIRRFNDVLKPGTFAAMLGSSMVQDFERAQLDDTGNWTAAYHPTGSEAGRYALGAYWELHKAPPPPPTKLDPFDKEAARLALIAAAAHRRGKRL